MEERKDTQATGNLNQAILKACLSNKNTSLQQLDTYGVQEKYKGPLIVCLCTKDVTKLL
jgi:hypothetical protein